MTWEKAAATPQRGGRLTARADELAREFCRCLQAQPDLVGWTLHRKCIQDLYPLFCKVQRVILPPPYKDFARELALLMPRKRTEKWRGGKRVDAFTVYLVPPLAEAAAVVVVRLAEHNRACA